MSPVNYLIAFKSKRKPKRVIHTNLLRRYVKSQEFINVIDVENDNDVAQCDSENNDSLGLLMVDNQTRNELVSKRIAHLNEQCLMF